MTDGCFDSNLDALSSEKKSKKVESPETTSVVMKDISG